GQGSLVVYNLGETPVTGLLALEGAAWRLPDGSRTVALSLAPGERQLVAVHVATGLSQFLASPVSARFDRGPVPPPVAPVARPAPAARSTPVATVKPPPPPPPAPDPETGESFDTYLRMENGNLYHARSGVRVTPTWRSALDRIDNFAPAFYGRHELPWRLSENRPAALVFFFRPTTYPAVFEITSPEIKRFAEPPPAK
ncbi:MAG: hypothetical protein NTV51_08500, partial [Verrucomicrobia bacterium]|nr:hypothetical protein [Verrucomicrobiota bacterium]